jgi:hypothetical protein
MGRKEDKPNRERERERRKRYLGRMLASVPPAGLLRIFLVLGCGLFLSLCGSGFLLLRVRRCGCSRSRVLFVLKGNGRECVPAAGRTYPLQSLRPLLLPAIT